MLQRWTDLPDWRGETVAVLGGGPSLTSSAARHVDQAHARGRCRVIAVNNSWELVPGAEILWACDLKWWRDSPSAAAALARFGGILATQDARAPQEIDARIRWLEASYDEHRNRDHDLRAHGGFDPRPGWCRTGKNGCYQALHLAVKAGAHRVLLLGCDMRVGPDGRTHWHEGHGRGPEADVYTKLMLPCWPTILPALAERGVEVINCSPGSALTCFPIRPVEEVL